MKYEFSICEISNYEIRIGEIVNIIMKYDYMKIFNDYEFVKLGIMKYEILKL